MRHTLSRGYREATTVYSTSSSHGSHRRQYSPISIQFTFSSFGFYSLDEVFASVSNRINNVSKGKKDITAHEKAEIRHLQAEQFVTLEEKWFEVFFCIRLPFQRN